MWRCHASRFLEAERVKKVDCSFELGRGVQPDFADTGAFGARDGVLGEVLAKPVTAAFGLDRQAVYQAGTGRKAAADGAHEPAIERRSIDFKATSQPGFHLLGRRAL